MSTEACGQVQVHVVWVRTHDGVLVEVVVVVVARPGTTHSHGLHLGHAGSQVRPHVVLKEFMVHLKVAGCWLRLTLRRRSAADVVTSQSLPPAQIHHNHRVKKAAAFLVGESG